MLKDINGKTDLTFFNNEPITNIDELFNECRLFFSFSNKKIIGFAKFRPFLNTDNRYCNIMDRDLWYPITSVCAGLSIKIVNIQPLHIGLFSHIVPVDPKNKSFNQIKNTNPKAKKYWKRKIKEKEKNEKYLIDLEEKSIKDAKRKEILINTIGEKVPRIPELNHIIKDDITEILFLKKIKEKSNVDFKNLVLEDLYYRLRLIDFLEIKNIENDSIFKYYVFRDVKYKDKLLHIKDKINEKPKTIIDLIKNIFS